jgi:hypothetical protein
VVGITCLGQRTPWTVYHGRDAAGDKGVFKIEWPAEVGGDRIEPTACLVCLASSARSPTAPIKIFPEEVTYATLPKCEVKVHACTANE